MVGPTHDLWEEGLHAVTIGDGVGLERLVESAPSLASAVDARGRSLLWFTALEGFNGHTTRYVALVACLIEAGAPVDVFAAAWLDDSEVLSEILDTAPAAVFARDAEGRTPLHHAADRGGVGVGRQLLALAADPEARDHLGRTPFQICAAPSPWRPLLALALARLLIEAGTTVDLGDAAALGFLDVVEQILSTGASVNSMDSEGRTPLLRAVEEGRVGVVDQLLRAGANPELGTRAGRLPLHVAVARVREGADGRLVQSLIRAGANPDSPDRTGESARDKAVRWNLPRLSLWMDASGKGGSA